MFVFKRAPRQSLSDLENFLREVGDEPIVWLEREVKSWGEFSYAELEELILSGRAADLIDWQNRYAEFVNTKLSPLWLTAIQVAAYNSTRGKITIDDSDPRVKDFLRTRAADLIRDLSDESRRAIANVILHGQAEHLAPREIARQIRPLIGLNARQAQANVNYRQKIFRQLIDNGLSINAANQRADRSAVKYASKQHRQRAETIVHTELARAYNQGAHDGILSAVQAKLMNHCEMIWTTAGTNRVCGRCLELKDTVVGRTNEQGVQLPPLHPRCRCTISYREMTDKPTSNPPAPKNPLSTPPATSGNVQPNSPTISPLSAPPATSGNIGSTTNALGTLHPTAVGGCKTFDELKLYWADNYNMKIDDAIGKLHFDSVRQALAGVEAVLKEFPPATQHLREFGLLNASIMATEHGNSKINFNPEYFNDRRKLLSVLIHGTLTQYYHKNMSPFSVGAHEAGHLVEYWLLAKYGVFGDVSKQVLSRKIVSKAYTRAIQTSEGKGKTIVQLKSEIARHASEESLSECLADAVSDYLTNGEQAALLSREIWHVLKEELLKMTSVYDSEMIKYSLEEFMKYGLFDEDGCIIGVKDDAPPEFKEAYEHDKKRREDLEARGID